MKKLSISALFLLYVLTSFSMERRLSVYEISQKSDLIFTGVVIKTESGWNSSKTMIFTEITFRKTSLIYSNDKSLQAGNDEVIITMPGGSVDGTGMAVCGNPVFEPGNEYLLMTRDDGILYSNPILGGSQGLFRIIHDGITGRKYVLSAGGRVIGYDSLGFSVLSPGRVGSIRNGVVTFIEGEKRTRDYLPPVSSNPACSASPSLKNPLSAPLDPIVIEDFAGYLVNIALKKKFTPLLMLDHGNNLPAKSYWNSKLGIFESEKSVVPNHRPGPVAADLNGTVRLSGNDLKSDHLNFPQSSSNAGSDAPSGGAMGACGYQDLFLVMEDVPSTWWTYPYNEDCMWQWNLFMNMYQVTASNGTFAWQNGVNEYTGFPSDATLISIYGFSYNGDLAVTVIGFNCSCCKILESDISFNPDYTWTDDFNFALLNPYVINYNPITIHELGHTWGYMNGIYDETYDYDYNSVMHGYDFTIVEDGNGIHETDAYMVRTHYANQTGALNITDIGVESYYASDGLNHAWPNQSFYAPGEAITVNHVTVENMSSAALSDVRIRIYLSPDKSITTADYQCGGNSSYWSLGIFNLYQEHVYDYNTFIPASIPAGEYYVGIIATINGSSYAIDDYGANNATFLRFKICVEPSQPASISGPASVCVDETNTYTIPAVLGATSYTWTLPSGWTGSSTSTSISATAGTGSGNITVKANGPCGSGETQSKYITVSAIPAQPGTITGPASVCAGATNLYSILMVSGATSYTWVLPAGWSGSSTSTFIYATAGSVGGNIIVKANNTCGSSPGRTKNINVATIPAQPGTISGTASACVGTTNIYSIAAVPGATSYTWTLPAGWSGSSISSSITATAGSVGGTISVTASNFCGTGPAKTKSVIVITTPLQPGIIAGPSTVCPGSTNTYSVFVSGGATSYIWTLPSGWSGSSNTASINATAGPVGGTISVKAANSCGESPPQTKDITIMTVPVQPGVISGPATVCKNTANTYSIGAVSGATSYTWTLPSGWSGSSTSTSIIATANSTGGDVTVAANNSCGAGPVQTKSISVTTSTVQPGVISGPSRVCQGTTNIYSIVALPGVTSYAWTLPPGWTGSSTSTSISATAGITSGTISVTATNVCGTGAARLFFVTSTTVPSNPGTISGNISICQGSSQTYTVTNVPGQTYNWVFPSGWFQTSGGTSNTVVVTAGSLSGNVQVTPSNNCGPGAASSKWVTVNPLPVPLITGPASACAGSAGNVYSAPAGMVSYLWTISAGGIVTAGGSSSSNSVTVTWNATGAQSVSLNYMNANNCIATAPTVKNVAVTTPPPFLLTIGNIDVLSGQTLCWGATQTLTVAGGGAPFLVQYGGSASLIAGQKILMLPGMHAFQGAYLHASIAMQCDYCPIMPMDGAAMNGTDLTGNIPAPSFVVKPSFIVYPNPTSGKFTLELTGTEASPDVNIEVFTMQGAKVLKEQGSGKRKYELSLDMKPVGMYLMKVVIGNVAETVKIIKN